MSTSRERFLAQLERCVKYQNENIFLPDPPRSTEWVGDTTVILPREEFGNGETVEVDHSSVAGLRAPGEEPLTEWWV